MSGVEYRNDNGNIIATNNFTAADGTVYRNGQPINEKWPDGFYFIGELRRAVGLFDGAMSKSPKEAWEEAVAEVGRIRDIAESGKCWVCEERHRGLPT